MCTEQTQWLQCRTGSAVPKAGGTSCAEQGSISSAGLFWWLCWHWISISGPGDLIGVRNLKDSTADALLFCMMEVWLWLSMVKSTVFVVLAALGCQPFSLLSVCTHITVSDAANDVCVTCKWHNRCVNWRAVICVEGEVQWWGHTSLCSTCADCSYAEGVSFCQDVHDPLTGGGRHSVLGEFRLENLRYYCVENQAEVHTQDSCIRLWGVKLYAGCLTLCILYICLCTCIFTKKIVAYRENFRMLPWK